LKTEQNIINPKEVIITGFLFHMRHQFALYIGLSLGVVLLISACQVVDGPRETATLTPAQESIEETATAVITSTPAPVRGTVSIWHAWDESRLPALLSAIADFQDAYPDVMFDVQYIPSLDLEASFEVASSEGRGPDILIGPAEWGPSLYDQDWISDLVGLASTELLGSLNHAAVGAARYHDALIGVPVSLEGVVLYRNQAIISFSPATFGELIMLAGEATEGEVHGAYLERSFYFSGGHLVGLGGRLMDDEGMPAFNDQHGLDWIDLLRRYETVGVTEFFGDRDLQYFKENRAGIIIESTRIRESLKEAIGSANLAIDPWPIREDGSMAGFVQAENVYLAPQAMESDVNIAWMFIEFLLRPELQAVLADLGTIPATTPEAFTTSRILIRDDLIEQAILASPMASRIRLYRKSLYIKRRWMRPCSRFFLTGLRRKLPSRWLKKRSYRQALHLT